MQGEEQEVSKYENKKSSVSLNGKPQKGHKSWLHSIVQVYSKLEITGCLFSFCLLTVS
jgi:hypothetical protein